VPVDERLRGIGMTSQRTRDRLVQRLGEQGIQDTRVLEVMRHTPRHIFVDEALASRAYEDTALPIGYGQTISQPFVVARMTEVLLQQPCHRVLEIGTGCGYQTAVLAQLVGEVFSIERVGGLLPGARGRLRRLGLTNVRIKHGDGYAGWPQHAPYDGILLAAAPAQLPQALLEQLADGGQLVAPVGAAGEQRLVLVRRQGEEFQQVSLEPVSFVPLVGGQA